MFDAKLNYETRFFADEYEIFGASSVDLQYNNNPSVLKPIGTSRGITVPSGPISQTLSVNRGLLYKDPILDSYLRCSPMHPMAVSVYYEGEHYGFKKGYLNSHSINCAVGAVPKTATSFLVFDEMQKGKDASNNLDPREHPSIQIPNQGSISIDCDGSSTNRVVGFNHSLSIQRKIRNGIGYGGFSFVEFLQPIEYLASVEIDVDDAFLQSSFSFLEDRENKTVTLSIRDRHGDIIQTASVPNASLVSENLKISEDGTAKLFLTYVGHEKWEQGENCEALPEKPFFAAPPKPTLPPEEVEIIPQKPVEYDPSLPTEYCVFSVVLYDTAGDGWQGGKLNILLDGQPVTANSGEVDLTLSGSSTIYDFVVTGGSVLTVEYTEGLSSEQNHYSVFNSYGGEGTQLFASTVGQTPPLSQEINNSCGAVGSTYDCTFSIGLYDLFGEGWFGGFVNVLVNGIQVPGVTYATLVDGLGPTFFSFGVNEGDSIQVQYSPGTQGSIYNYYKIFDGAGGSGNKIFESTEGVEPDASVDVENTCNSIVLPPAPCTYSISLITNNLETVNPDINPTWTHEGKTIYGTILLDGIPSPTATNFTLSGQQPEIINFEVLQGQEITATFYTNENIYSYDAAYLIYDEADGVGNEIENDSIPLNGEEAIITNNCGIPYGPFDCTYSIKLNKLQDSFDDGWDAGGKITAVINGTPDLYLIDQFMGPGEGGKILNFGVNQGDTIFIEAFKNLNGFSDNNIYQVYDGPDGTGTEIFSVFPYVGMELNQEIYNDCGLPPVVYDCVFSITLYQDSPIFDNGWYGSVLTVLVNGVALPYLTNKTLYFNGSVTYNFNVNAGDIITVEYDYTNNQAGLDRTYDEINNYVVFNGPDGTGEELYRGNIGEVPPLSNTLQNNCGFVGPTTPSALTAVALSQTEIQLNWTDNSNDENGFVIQRSNDGSTWVEIATTAADITTFTDNSLFGSQLRYYRVASFYNPNSETDRSLYTAAASATTNPVSGDCLMSFALSHDDPVGWLGGAVASTMTVLVNDVAVPGLINIGSPDQGPEIFNFAVSKTDEIKYEFVAGTNSQQGLKIELFNALDGGGNLVYSRLSNPGDPLLTGTYGPIFTCGPSAPSGLTVTALSESTMNLSWVDNSLDEDGFQVERSTDQISWTVVVNLSANTVSFNDSGLSEFTTYYYRVASTYASGGESYSLIASDTTPGAATDDCVMSVAIFDSYGDGSNGTNIDILINGVEILTNLQLFSGSGPEYWDFAMSNNQELTVRVNDGSWRSEFSYIVYEGLAGSGPSVYSSGLNPPIGLTGVIYTCDLGVFYSTALGFNSMQLDWIDYGSSEDGYEIERSTDQISWTLITTTAADVITFTDTGLTPETLYYYRITDFYTGGGPSVSYETETTTDAASVTATPVSFNSMQLDWDDFGAAEDGYEVERSTDQISWTLLTTTAQDVVTFTDTGLISETLYYYRITSFFAGGGPVANITTQATTNPVSFTATSLGIKSIQLDWEDYGVAEDGYEIERSTDQISWTLLTTTAQDVVTFTDTGLISETLYYYRITDFYTGGGPSSIITAQATTDVMSFTATTIDFSRIQLDWGDFADGEDGYFIERSDSGGFNPWTAVTTTGPDVVTFTDTGLMQDNLYAYRITSVHTTGGTPVTYPLSGFVTARTDVLVASVTAVKGSFPLSADEMQLSWTDYASDGDGYDVEVSTDQTNWTLSGSTVQGVNTFTATGLSFLTLYYFRVTSIYIGGGPVASVTTSEYTQPDPNADCVLSIAIFDSFGDGSNGIRVQVISRPNGSGFNTPFGFNGVQLLDGFGPEYYNFSLNNTDELSTKVLFGQNPEQFRYVVYDGPEGSGNVLYDSGFNNPQFNIESPVLYKCGASAAPSNLTVSSATPALGQVQIDWTDNSNDEDGFIIERSLLGGKFDTWEELVTTSSNVTTYIDTVAEGQYWYYRIFSVKNGVKSYSQDSVGGGGSLASFYTGDCPMSLVINYSQLDGCNLDVLVDGVAVLTGCTRDPALPNSQWFNWGMNSFEELTIFYNGCPISSTFFYRVYEGINGSGSAITPGVLDPPDGLTSVLYSCGF